MRTPRQLDFFEQLEVVVKRHHYTPAQSIKVKRYAQRHGLTLSTARLYAELNGGIRE